MSLKEIRDEIDVIDFNIIRLLNNRMELALMAKKFKSAIKDSAREREILDRIRRNATGLIAAEVVERIYAEIMEESKNLQKRDYRLIAFQGEHGAYGETASKEWDSNLIPVPCSEFSQVFEGTESGLYDYGIVPVENTLGGVVGRVNELLIKTDLKVVGAVELPIHHCLLACPGTDYREIRAAYSHYQALAQCRHFLERNKIEPLPYSDTAGAAKMVAKTKPKDSVAIASRLSARLYNLEIIKEGIEDLDTNTTRFLVLSREEGTGDGNKCSLLFSTEHKAGTLFKVLEVFARRDINLTRIESIPSEPGNYVFFLDFIGSITEKKIVRALEEVEEITAEFRLMGCYRERKVA